MARRETDLSINDYLAAYAVTSKRSQLCKRLQLYRFVADHLTSPDASVIDVGCGEGFGTFYLSTRVRKAVGLEAHGEVVRHARRMYGDTGAAFHALDVTGDITDLPKADVVCAIEVIEHIADDIDFLRRLAEFVDGDGLIVVSTPNRLLNERLYGRVYEFHEREYSLEELRAAVRTACGVDPLMYCVDPGAVSRIRFGDAVVGNIAHMLPERLLCGLRKLRFVMHRPSTEEGWRRMVLECAEEPPQRAIVRADALDEPDDCAGFMVAADVRPKSPEEGADEA